MRLSGFDESETGFWLQAYPDLFKINSLDEPADMLLLRSSASPVPADAQHWVAGARVVVIDAEGAAVSEWRKHLKASLPLVREYALLPAQNPRVVVPLTNRQHAVAALTVHRPGRRLARWGVGLARLLARIGSYRLLRRRVLIIATRGDETLPQGARLSGLLPGTREAIDDFALYLGTPDDNRKTVVLPLGAAQAQVLLKVASSARARDAVRNEAAALGALAMTPLAAQVPRLHRLVDSDSVVTLHQEYRPRTRCQAGVEAHAVVGFLRQLAEVDAHFEPLAKVLERLPKRKAAGLTDEVEAACVALEGNLQALADSEISVRLQRVHGDFAPWNCAWTDKGLFVYDWEESKADGLALGDAFYYSIAPALLVKRNPNPLKTLQAALRFADKVIEASGIELDSRVYLALWLLGRPDKTGLYGELIVLLERNWR